MLGAATLQGRLREQKRPGGLGWGVGVASVRLEDSVWTDPRFVVLGKLLGTNRFDAVGRVAALWSYCTEKETYFLSGAMIDTLAEHSGFADLLSNSDVNLAEFIEKKSQFRIKGTRGRIEWIGKLRNNSEKGGAKTKAKWQAKRLAKRGPEAGPDEGPTITTPVPVTSPALVTAPTISKNKNLPESPSASSVPTWEAYRDAYQKRYGVPPVRNASVNSQLKNLVKRLGEEEAPLVAEFYLTHNDAFYIKCCHSVGMLLRDCEKLRTEWASGRKILGTQARDMERMQHNADVFERVAARIERKQGA